MMQMLMMQIVQQQEDRRQEHEERRQEEEERRREREEERRRDREAEMRREDERRRHDLLLLQQQQQQQHLLVFNSCQSVLPQANQVALPHSLNLQLLLSQQQQQQQLQLSGLQVPQLSLNQSGLNPVAQQVNTLFQPTGIASVSSPAFRQTNTTISSIDTSDFRSPNALDAASALINITGNGDNHENSSNNSNVD